MITLAQVEKSCPAIFADVPHPKTSPGYRFIPTKETLASFIDKGWTIKAAVQTKSRDLYNRQFAKHMITMVHKENPLVKPEIGSVCPSMYLVNSHDHSSTYSLIMGLFRLICTNGMMACTGDVWGISLRHDTDQDIGQITDRFHSHANGLMETAELWSAFQLNRDQKIRLATKGRELRFGPESTVDPSALLLPRRAADSGDSLWNTFNVIQENITKGGIRFSGMRRQSRVLSNIGKLTESNLGLWQEAANIASGN